MFHEHSRRPTQKNQSVFDVSKNLADGQLSCPFVAPVRSEELTLRSRRPDLRSRIAKTPSNMKSSDRSDQFEPPTDKRHQGQKQCCGIPRFSACSYISWSGGGLCASADQVWTDSGAHVFDARSTETCLPPSDDGADSLEGSSEGY